MFQTNLKDVTRLIKSYKLNEKEFKNAQRNVINSQAFGTRKSAIAVLNQNLTIRNKRFTEGSIRVQMATFRSPTAVIGSIYRRNFTGWIEQETGQLSDRKRIPTLSARRGDVKKQIAPSLRMKSGNRFISDKSTISGAKSKKARVIGMLSYVRRKKYNKPFILSGWKGYRKGLYKRIKRKNKLIQDIGNVNKSVKKLPWMRKAESRFMRKNAPIKLWADAIKRTVKFRQKKGR